MALKETGGCKMNDIEKDINQLIDELIRNTHQIEVLNAENLRIISLMESKIKEAGEK